MELHHLFTQVQSAAHASRQLFCHVRKDPGARWSTRHPSFRPRWERCSGTYRENNYLKAWNNVWIVLKEFNWFLLNAGGCGLCSSDQHMNYVQYGCMKNSINTCNCSVTMGINVLPFLEFSYNLSFFCSVNIKTWTFFVFTDANCLLLVQDWRLPLKPSLTSIVSELSVVS